MVIILLVQGAHVGLLMVNVCARPKLVPVEKWVKNVLV